MPRLGKEALSQYIRTECRRQLRLYLSPDSGVYKYERDAQQMPPPQPPRPGLEQITQAGEQWQAAKLHDLTLSFGPAAVLGDRYVDAAGQQMYRPIDLGSLLQSAAPGQFLVEAQYNVGATFESDLGINGHKAAFSLDYASVRPDLIEVLVPGRFTRFVTPSGNSRPLLIGDDRLQLRVVDIKLTSEPSPSYFAEVAYYSMVLAGWLIDNHLHDRFVVAPNGAVWPGSHDASSLAQLQNESRLTGVTPTPDQLRDALQEDLEPVPFDVFAFRVRRFLQQDVPEVLAKRWQTLEWHVDNRCKGCDNLGYPWTRQGQPTNHPDHCMPMAERQEHLSRVAFVSRGASLALRDKGVPDVPSLAKRSPSDSAFDAHHVLKATRTVVSGRATSLQLQQEQIPPAAGTSAVMPRWSDLRVYLSVDFDLGSAITFAFGVQAFWLEPQAFGNVSIAVRQHRAWTPQAFVVDLKELKAEERELLAFLAKIDFILTESRNMASSTSVQFYLWDSLQYDHLCRVVGRHLSAILRNQVLSHLAWLFPPEQLQPNSAIATLQSPITVVRNVVRSVLAVPVPHYYSLLDTARAYHPQPPVSPAPLFSIHPLFEDALSDQIPSERAHEIWSRSTKPYHGTTRTTLIETVEKRLKALEAVVRRLGTDLGPQLKQKAPQINVVQPPSRQNRIGMDGQLWHAFSKLDSALGSLEVHQIRAMPPHEREARFRSARLSHRLTSQQETQALVHFGLQAQVGRRVYALAPGSREVKAKEGDFLFALAPEDKAGFLDQSFDRATAGTQLQQQSTVSYIAMERVTNVAIKALDRSQGLIVLDADRSRPTILDDLERHGVADLSSRVVLDPVHRDYFTSKLLKALQAIGNPPSALSRSIVQQAVGQTRGRGARRSGHTPPADLLWDAAAMYNSPVVRSLASVQSTLGQRGIVLNPTQWSAWTEALSRRLQLIWGPPGTGKSRTAQAIVVGAALEAHQRRNPIRILISASTYTAIDNVLLDVKTYVNRLMLGAVVEVHRVRSKWRQPDPNILQSIDTELNRDNPSSTVLALQTRLQQSSGITIVGATPEQTHNLLTLNNGAAQREFFDLILIDEASQMDVPHAILPLCALATGGTVVLAGDPKQLPPIHQAEAPAGLESMVGSIYEFIDSIPGISSVMLDENYRSNETIVRFSLNAGYERTLSAYSPNLELDFQTPLPMSRPPGWPVSLYWTPEWSTMLGQDHPVSCFVYPDGHSSQWNLFEADAVAAMVRLLASRMGSQLRNERDATTGQFITKTAGCYSSTEFWERAIGVVTPHRAQQGLIVGKLQRLFGNSGVPQQLIRSAVDTVERFQGQQRDVIIATFALGDPDAIQSEDEFLLSLNRFNVMASRARAKLIVLVSQQVVDHLSSDLDTLWGSGLLKSYVESYCHHSRPMTLGVVENGAPRTVDGTFKWAD